MRRRFIFVGTYQTLGPHSHPSLERRALQEHPLRATLPDPTANPYLAFAVMLAAGLEGIEKNMQPPAARRRRNLSHVDGTRAGLETLPGDA